jgi:hypothetical protein
MNKLLPTAITTLLFAILALTFPAARAYAAPGILFDKTTLSVAQNTTFTLSININVETNTAQSSRATVQYAPADFDVVQVADGHFFPSFAQANDATNGLLEITGYTTSAGSGSTANGVLATVTFKAKKGSGSSTITFSCANAGHDTNILTVSGQNILSSCTTQTNQVAVSYTGAGNPTNTPTPTPDPDATPTPTPIQSNNTVPVCANLAADKTSAVGIPLPVTFTCSGVDTDGYINAAYFDFGDGTTDTIVKNVGSPGAISTTHTYTTIGSLGVSCKVQDNNKVWSQGADVCKKVISIKSKPKVVVRTGTSASNSTPTPTPTPHVLSLVFVTPTATPSPELTPLPIEEPVQEQSSPAGWLAGSLGVIGIGGAIYLLSKRSHKPPTTIPPSIPPVVH